MVRKHGSGVGDGVQGIRGGLQGGPSSRAGGSKPCHVCPRLVAIAILGGWRRQEELCEGKAAGLTAASSEFGRCGKSSPGIARGGLGVGPTGLECPVRVGEFECGDEPGETLLRRAAFKGPAAQRFGIFPAAPGERLAFVVEGQHRDYSTLGRCKRSMSARSWGLPAVCFIWIRWGTEAIRMVMPPKGTDTGHKEVLGL